MTGRKFKYMLVICLCVIMCRTAVAADVNVTSRVNRTNITLSDQLLLVVTLTGSDAGKTEEPKLEPMPDFTIHDRRSERRTTIVNFQISHTLTYTYYLYPEKPGIFDVGAVSVNIGNDVITAPAIKVTVISGPKSQTPVDTGDGVAESAGDINVFITANVDKKEAYVGEQVTFTFELYRAIPISANNEYDPPVSTGFWSVDLPEIPTSRKRVRSNEYTTNTLKKALFPTTSGELTIGSATFEYSIQRSIFEASPSKRLRTQPITINVKPLPERGKPDGFGGAVGNFELSSDISSTTVRAGDVMTVRVSVNGTGNLDLISTIGEPDLSKFRTYDPKITEQISNSGFTVGGMKTWEYVVIPKEQGSATIGPFTLSYFNPDSETYHTITTQPYVLNVTPSAAVSVSDAPERGGEGFFRSIATDIRYIKPEKTALGSISKKIYTKISFYLFYILPLSAFIVSYAHKRRRDTIERNTGLKRKLNAHKHAQRRLGEASDMLKSNDIKALCGKLHETIINYIGDMLNIDTGSLTVGDIEQALTKNGVESEYAEHIRKTLEMCDFVRFASLGDERAFQETILNDTQEIITNLKEML